MPIAQPILTNEDWLNIEREYCSRSLANFIERAWQVIETDRYIHGWHVDAIAEHYEAITYGQINRLLVNVPPGTMKSTIASVFWPAWEWGPKKKPHHRFIGASHEEGLAIRDTLKMRRLIESEWYKELWPEVQLTGDQNEKKYYENNKNGFRQACAVGSMTGKRGHRVIWDDPHSVEKALSDIERATAVRIFKETLPTRLTDPITSAIIVVMQRIHEDDVSGHILASDLGYTHLCLPMEFEPERRCVTSIGFSDPRTQEDELLFPARFPREVVERDKKAMGTMAVAGQLQQRPAPRKGAFFEWENIELVDAYPQIMKYVRYWDKAGTAGGGAWTAGVLMGLGADTNWYVLDVIRGQWSSADREKTIKQTAQLDGYGIEIWIEQEPGSGGKESAEATVKNLAGFTCYTERPTGDKAVRAEPYSVQVEAGNIKVLNRNWTKDFIDEHKTFPVGKFKDQIDAASGAFNKLAQEDLFGILGSRQY